MSQHDDARSDWPFGRHDYEISYSDQGAPREVSIKAFTARPMVVGDLYTIGGSSGLRDVVVAEITRVDGGGWNARCSMVEPKWM